MAINWHRGLNYYIRKLQLTFPKVSLISYVQVLHSLEYNNQARIGKHFVWSVGILTRLKAKLGGLVYILSRSDA